jgi:hypothetical protein
MLAKTLLVVAFILIGSIHAQGQEKKAIGVYLTSDCTDTAGSNAASALREKIRGSNGYVLASGPTKGHAGYEILLTCAAIPGHESSASAVSYVFDTFLPDEARYFVQPGIGVVGADAVNQWSLNTFSQFDNWLSTVLKAIGH